MDNKRILKILNENSLYTDVEWSEEEREHDCENDSMYIKEFVYSVPSGTMKEDILQSVSVDTIKAIVKEAQKELILNIKNKNLCDCSVLDPIYRPCNLCNYLKSTHS